MAEMIKVYGKDAITEGLKPDTELPERVALGDIHVFDGITWLKMGVIKRKKDQAIRH